MRKLIMAGLSFLFMGTVVAGAGAAYVVWRFGQALPDHQQLIDYQPPTTTRVYAGDGRLLAEYATEKRVFVPISSIPKRVQDSFIAAEDGNFRGHHGVDPQSILRAAVQNVGNVLARRRLIGASTITQQVAKNLLLTNELSVARKVKEMILAYRIETVLSKDRILELYLNQIYLGGGAYGVAAASQNYFNKPLDQLTLAETAYLAILPKAPNNYNPAKNPEGAKARRNYVLERMRDLGMATAAEVEAAAAAPIVFQRREPTEIAKGDFFAEEVRRDLAQRYGDGGLYKGGLSVHTSLDPKLQEIAERVLRKGLVAYDVRHGYRGPLEHGDPAAASIRLPAANLPVGAVGWKLAIVTRIDDQAAEIMVKGGTFGRIPMSELAWARPPAPEQTLGPPVKRPADVLKPGDLILVEPLPATKPKAAAQDPKKPAPILADEVYALRQLPEVAGALVALDPNTGRVLALQGGFSYDLSQFDRVTQAIRQPGSSFKPFVYMAALDNGFTPSTQVLDLPFVVDLGPGAGKWKPAEYEGTFNGPTTLRVALEESKNLVTIRVASTIGMDKVADIARRFGVVDNLPQYLSMALGAGDTTLLRMATGYAMIDNGGRKVTPTLIDRVQDRRGVTIFRADARPCPKCDAASYDGGPPPVPPDVSERVEDPVTTYQMVSMMEGVVQRGTAAGAFADLRRPIAGKTGTTNDFTDNWFIGYSPDLVAGVWIGFDKPQTLGRNEQGARNAAPIVRNFLAEALADKPIIPFRVPSGVRLLRVNPKTGLLAESGDQRYIYEAFKPGTEPTADQPGASPAGGPAAVAPGGLY